MLLVCTAETMVVANWTKRQKGIRFGGDGRRETENLACTYECLRGRRSRKVRNSCVCVCVCVRSVCVCVRLSFKIWEVSCFSIVWTRWRRHRLRVPAGRDRRDSWGRRRWRPVCCYTVCRIASGTNGTFPCHRRRACKWRASTGNHANRRPCPTCRPVSSTGICPTSGTPWPKQRCQS